MFSEVLVLIEYAQKPYLKVNAYASSGPSGLRFNLYPHFVFASSEGSSLCYL